MGLNASNMKEVEKIQDIMKQRHYEMKKQCLKYDKTRFTKPRRRNSLKHHHLKNVAVDTLPDCLDPFHYAAQTGDCQTIRFYINNGHDVNTPSDSSNGQTPAIVYAAANGHITCLDTLLTAGANPNASDRWNNTALFKAVSYSRTSCVKVLLEKGANPTIANRWGALPVQIATLQGSSEIVQILLQYGAAVHPGETGYHGDTTLPSPLVASATRCHLDCLRLILSRENSPLPQDQLELALTMAMYYFLCACAEFQYSASNATLVERFECIKMLVTAGASITTEHVKMTCYHYFIPVLNLKAYVQMLHFLLQSARITTSSPSWQHVMMVLFGHVTRLGKYKWPLIQQLCDIGFTPNQDLIDSLAFTFTQLELEQLKQLNRQPRQLGDLCRQAVRHQAQYNVQHTLRHLELPSVAQAYVLAE